jgi:hypothetical protein
VGLLVYRVKISDVVEVKTVYDSIECSGGKCSAAAAKTPPDPKLIVEGEEVGAGRK